MTDMSDAALLARHVEANGRCAWSGADWKCDTVHLVEQRQRDHALRDELLTQHQVMADELEAARPVLDWALEYLDTNDEPCRFDHHGGCQAHLYLSLSPGEECPQGVAQLAARAFLATEPPSAEGVR